MARLDTALESASPESAAFSRPAGCHVRSPDGIAALLSIMGHGRRVQTGVPMTHLFPKRHFMWFVAAILVMNWGWGDCGARLKCGSFRLPGHPGATPLT